jgi:L-rhamnose mutarotase
MQRTVLHERVLPGTETTFDARYRAIPDELRAAIAASGIRQLSGYRRGTDVWWYAECEPDAPTALTALRISPAHRAWERSLRDVVARITDGTGDPLEYVQVFHTDRGPALGEPVRRALISLVIDTERAAEYDGLHADTWPDMLAALADSGYRRYSGFRRGAHVVYYGEYHPDLETVSARMAEHEVNDRWRQAFEGIITTITGSDGRLFTADEVFHVRS